MSARLLARNSCQASPLRLGIIGSGFGLDVHLPAALSLPGVTVAALADGGSGRAARAAAALDPAPAVFPAGLALIAQANLDAVLITTPPALHAPLACAALARGLAVLVEKPAGRTLAEAAAIAAVPGSGRVAVGFCFRYDPGLAALLDAVRAGRIGAVQRVQTVWLTGGGANPARPWAWRHDRALGGGVLREFGSHALDIQILLAGAPVEVARGLAAIRRAHRPGPDGAPRAVSGEDAIDLALHFANGVTGALALDTTLAAPPGHAVTVWGEGGELAFRHAPPYAASSARLTLTRPGAAPEALPIPVGPPGAGSGEAGDSRIPMMRALLADFAAACRGEMRPHLPRLADALAVHRAIALSETVHTQAPA